MLQRTVRIAVLVLLAASAGCTYHAADAPSGLDRGSIEQTTEYMKWAFENESAAHVYACLSEDLKDRENLSLSDVDLFFGQIESRVKKLLGDIDAIKIEKIDKRDDRTAWVTYRSGGRRAVVRFILETTFEIVPSDDDDDGDFDLLPSMGSTMTYEDGQMVLRLPDNDLGLDPEAVHRVTIINAWLVDALDQQTVEAVKTAGP